MQKDTAYELQVDIEKDYSGFKEDIESVSKLIDRGENYEETIQRVGFYARLRQFIINENLYCALYSSLAQEIIY